MIKALRKRFIITAMVSVAIVIAVMIVVINAVNYVRIVREADSVLSFLQNNDGFFPKHNEPMAPEGGPPMKEMTPETPYMTRFFSVTVSAEGEIVSADTVSIAAVDRNEAVRLAESVYGSGKIKGFSGVYRYSVTETGDGHYLLLFLDRRMELDSFSSFLITSFAVAFFALAGVFALVLLFSKRMLKPVAESYAKQKRFITDAGHELKTPLSVINANTEVLEMTQGENQWTRSIKNQVDRLSSLTDNLISLARMDEENSRLIMTQFSISDAVEECLPPFSELAERCGKRIVADIQKNLTCDGNEDAIRRLAGLLLDNAIKYSSDGSDIQLTLKAAGRGVTLQVKNTVDGIEKGSHNEFLERFYRADDSRSQREGYGIGLSIASAICQSHRGRIAAYSDDGKSLTVTATI